MLLISPSDFHVFDHRVKRYSNGAVSSWELLFYFSIPVVIVIIALVYTWFRNGGEFWKESVFLPGSKYSDKNYARILVAFGCVISFREEKYVIREKLSWINSYLSKNSDLSGLDVLATYEQIVSSGINIQKLVAWAKKHLDKSKKVKLLEFVVQLASTDGSINSRESEFIFYLLGKLTINIDSLSQPIQDLLIEESRPQESVQKKNVIYYFEVLGLQEDATPVQIKNAYRKLVKIHHPDNHRRLTEAERKKHVAKFLEIQQAYEILTSEKDNQ